MKKIFASTFAFAISIITQAQTAFDVFSYKEPTGYQREVKTNVISYSKSNTKDNSYCIIGLYAASTAAATEQQTFAKEWKELVEMPWGATNPQIENSDDVNGWKAITGTSTFEFNGGKCAVMQFCFVNNTQTASIIVLTNSKSYEQDITVLLESLHLSKTRTTDNNKPSSVNNSGGAKPQSIIGEWYLSDGNAKVTLLFGANGRYDKGALVDRRLITNLAEANTIKGKGTYTLYDNTLTLSPTSGSKEVYQIRFSTSRDDEGNPLRILHLKRQVDGGQLYQSDYYFVPSKNEAAKSSSTQTNLNSVKANVQTDKLTGVWVAYYLSYVTKEMMFDQKVFLPNGQFLNDMPIGGVDNFDATDNPIYTYKLSGNNGTYIDAENKFPGTFTIKAANKIELESHTYSKSADINGKLFNASYTSWSNEDSPEFKEQPIGNRPVIHFYADGKFYNEGIFKHLHDIEPNSRQGKGTYFIKNYSLYLKYDDGRPVQKYSIATWGESTKFEETKILMLSGGALFKMKKP